MKDIEVCIDKAISDLAKDFMTFPNKFLTEDDVRIHLSALLMPAFREIEDTKDGDKSIALHAEVRWWGPQGINKRSDIVIAEVSSMIVTRDRVKAEHDKQNIPEKGYSILRPLAAIEIKFRRPDSTTDETFVDSVNKDIEKLATISKTIGTNTVSPMVCRVVAFDKKSKLSMENFSKRSEVRTTYKFGERHLSSQ